MNYTIYIQEKKMDSFLKDNMKEFAKRLSRYCKIQIVQLKKEQDIEKQKIRAGKNVKLVEQKSTVSSEEFALYIQNMELHGISNCNFFLQCSPNTLEYEEFAISQFAISPGLLGAILCEQIYRGYRIIHGQPYHK